MLLKTKNDFVNITTQQNTIIKYAKNHGFSLDSTEIENSTLTETLEDRKEFKGFLKSLNNKDNILIYDLWVYSKNLAEVIKVLECLLKRDITTIVCSKHNMLIGSNTSSLELMGVLSNFKGDEVELKKTITQGRPKGRMSKSKFDKYRTKIVNLLEKGNSVSKIARVLEVSRTSLKDYINSRGLKELVQAKKTLLKEPSKSNKIKNIVNNSDCLLIQENKGR
jgi:DNA invertase Pin-like site-specific DNA recombinase